ncbi:hypothetical protein [Sphingomonas sp. Leaf25]|uniref:hypothetical protein n=1 Tax=Sphingomonas sp. Leaf25 TaxID=1735692 RepID=UPI0006FAEF60|nr:hypothetical protein [Sphingomonas sp. Leaf25]KQN06818.1 hypothetical protein ASE78_14345 [Sphingomonas sp. Leaf25]
MIDRYDWAGGQEALWRFGPADGPVVALALPPFEEANRTRTFAVGLLRALAERGVGSMLPDLPGQGDSLIPTEAASLSDWRAAFAAACATSGRPVIAASIRGGALIDGEADVAGRWQLSPQPGARLVRELHRVAKAAGEADSGEAVAMLSGNRIARPLLDALGAAVPAVTHPVRVVRLGTDPAPADLRIDAAPLWRRAEPGDDRVLAEELAEDLAAWSRACAGI